MNAFANWIAQIVSVTLFSLRTIPARKGAAITTAVGVAGVVMVFVGVLSIAAGFSGTLRSSGSPDGAIVLRASANGELASILPRDQVLVVGDGPGVARGASGPLASPEVFVVINLPTRNAGGDANVPMRGVTAAAFEVRDGFEIVEGRNFEPGRSEVIVGINAARNLEGATVGNTLTLGQEQWQVVGVFRAGGGASESELWTDAAILQTAYQRGSTYQSIMVRLAAPERFQEFKDWLTTNPQLTVQAQRQEEFYADQSGLLSTFIEGVGVFIALMMAVGALFGALNTMYSAVAGRVREIATLRALGFGSSPVIVAVLCESLIVALVGGVGGAVAAYIAFDGYTASTLNFQSFSQVMFAFRVTPALLLQAIVLSGAIGLLGGLFPAIRAARIPVAAALRET
jgi:putative ABC transport system permease protein